MKTDRMGVAALLLLVTLAAGVLRGESPGGRRFEPTLPFEVLATAPEDALALAPETISSDIEKIARVRAPLGQVSVDDLERWRALDVAVLAELGTNGVRRCALGAYLLGYAGIVAAPSEELRLALADIRAIARLNELSHRARGMKSPDKIWLEGRRGLFQIDNVNAWRDDPDLTRLNAYARIRRLAALTGEKEGLDFDLDFPARPPLEPKPFATSRKDGQPTGPEIRAAICDSKHMKLYDSIMTSWWQRMECAREEELIGFPDPGIPTCCPGEYENERLFFERRLEILRRKYEFVVTGLRPSASRKKRKSKEPAVLSETDADQRKVYDMLPEFDLLGETVARLRIAYMLDRLAGREIRELPPQAKKPPVLELEETEEIGLDL